jgi:hypothetical protein
MQLMKKPRPKLRPEPFYQMTISIWPLLHIYHFIDFIPPPGSPPGQA